jgi:hypothetical protein
MIPENCTSTLTSAKRLFEISKDLWIKANGRQKLDARHFRDPSGINLEPKSIRADQKRNFIPKPQSPALAGEAVSRLNQIK